jgi:hypothetical protein
MFTTAVVDTCMPFSSIISALMGFATNEQDEHSPFNLPPLGKEILTPGFQEFCAVSESDLC